MKRLLCVLSALVLLLCISTVFAPVAEAESVSVKTIDDMLGYTGTKKPVTLFLEKDLNFIGSGTQEFASHSKQMIIDGQGHSLKFTSPTSQDIFNVIASGTLRLQNISLTGNTSFWMDQRSKGRIELDHVTFIGRNIILCSAPHGAGEAVLTNVLFADIVDEKWKYNTIIVSDNVKMTLGQDCQVSKDWELHATDGGKAVVNCDYYDATLECWTKAPVSFSGDGTGHGKFRIIMRTNGVKADADIRTDELEILFTDPEAKKKQTATVKGSAHQVVIFSSGSPIRKSQELKLDLTGVERLVFKMYFMDKADLPEDTEEFRSRISKSFSHISLKTVTDPEGNPIQSVDYQMIGWDENNNVLRVEWTENVN